MIVQINIVEKSNRNPCGSDSFPFKKDKCNQIWAGAKAAERYMTTADDWEMNWINAQSFDEIVRREDASDGDVLFMDRDTAQVFFKLPGWFVSKERVTKIIRLMLKYKFANNGEPGYIINDPSDEENGEFWSLPALQTSGFRSKFGVNALGSPLEAIMGFVDSLIDDLLPDVADLIPWQAYVVAAGYTALKTKNELPKNPTLKSVKWPAYAYGLGTGYLAHRAIRSYKAKQLREENIVAGLPAASPTKRIGRYTKRK